jgi:hypothetical protein
MTTRANLRLIKVALVIGASLLTMSNARAQTASSTNGVQVPADFRDGTVLVRAKLNGSEPLRFKLDTGFGITTIHPQVAETLNLKPAGPLTIIGIAGNEEARTYTGAVFDFGSATYSPDEVAVLPSDGQGRRRGRDGILGEGFFRRFVVEINAKDKLLRLHKPEQFDYAGKGEIIPLEFKTDTPIIEAAVVPPGKAAVRATFELDLGCSGCMCLGQPFVEENKLLDEAAAGRKSERVGVGGSAAIQSGRLEQLQLGKLTVNQPSANFFLRGSPAHEGHAGHIGMGALQQFKVILDYSRKRMILEPQ